MSEQQEEAKLNERLHELNEAWKLLRTEVEKVVVGQEEILEQLMVGVLARGHCILEGAPGLAKTLLVTTIGRCLDLQFSRIQFTPDLMPSDITGTEIMQEDRTTGQRAFEFAKGPIFANIVLSDEINRAPPKTQAALLEGMQERQVSAAGKRHPLPDPFFVLATMNPVEQEGTYPLPEAQLDRFIIKAIVDYPEREAEKAIYKVAGRVDRIEVQQVLSQEKLKALQELILEIEVSDYVLEAAVSLVRGTRADDPESPSYVRNWVSWGAGPRAGQALVLACRARAALYGRAEATMEDLRALAVPVMRHRLVLNYHADAEGMTADAVIKRLLDDVPKGGAEGTQELVDRVRQS
jgi:MoxR-like ATPase